MLDPTPIHSAQNPYLKRARAALRGGVRECMVLEGDRLIDDALRAGLVPEFFLVAAGRAERARELEASVASGGAAVRIVADELLASASALEASPGVLAVLPVPERAGLESLPGAADALVVVVAGVQDPGNLGALSRTAEAAGAAALVVLPGGCRPWNEKALRGSMGSLLRLPVLEPPVGDNTAAATWEALSSAGFRHVVARTRGGVEPDALDWSGRLALWVTAESGRLPDALELRLDEAEGVTIPMAGEVESLNVTTAAAVLLFAARRSSSTRRNA